MTRIAALVAALAVVPAAFAADAPNPYDYGPLPTIGGVSAESRIEPRFTKAASKIAYRRAELRCWSRADWERLDQEWQDYVGSGLDNTNGYVRKSANERIHLSPTVCTYLVKLTYRHYRPTARRKVQQDLLAGALLTLAHEAQHVGGISSETKAECYGAQRVRTTALSLGVNKTYAATLAHVAWTRIYSMSSLKVRGCRNNGPLDLNRRSNIWP